MLAEAGEVRTFPGAAEHEDLPVVDPLVRQERQVVEQDRPVAVLLSSVENEAIGRVGHHRSTYGRSDSRPRTNNVQLPRSFFAGWGALVIERKSSTGLSSGWVAASSPDRDGSAELHREPPVEETLKAEGVLAPNARGAMTVHLSSQASLNRSSS